MPSFGELLPGEQGRSRLFYADREIENPYIERLPRTLMVEPQFSFGLVKK